MKIGEKMPEILIKNITKQFGKKPPVVENLNLNIPDRSFITLLGPSGCGKTTTLRMVAGLETPTSGEITIGGKVVFSSEKGIDLPPDQRGVGFLFQNYALWPHMTVWENITFGLENLKWPKDKIKARADELMAMLKIEEYRDRYPAELSGGQQQRVAIARTLSTGPKILFMDEPLSNLDAKLRMEMRTELKRLHMETDSTFVYVTHDQLEAMTLSTRICLLREGELQQYAPPLEIYNEPTNAFVADFIGSPNINLVEGEVLASQANCIKVALGKTQLDFIPRKGFEQNSLTKGEKITLGIRPENIILDEEGTHEGKIYSTLPSGMETVVKINLEGVILTAVVFGSIDFAVNETVRFNIKDDKNIIFAGKEQKAVVRGALK